MFHKLSALAGRTVRRTQFGFIHSRFDPYTMVGRQKYISNIELARVFRHVPGAIVECGTWKGGMIAGIAQALGPQRSYFLFDSYEGLPPAEPIDGEGALQYQRDTASPLYFDNCFASIEDAREAMRLSGATNVTITKGWFSDTLPKANFPDGIAILRMDGDWYQSTIEILDALYHQVNEGGLILVDDYYAWQGCSRAVHDFLSKHKLPLRIRQHRDVCHIVKDTMGA